jgi:hypothetical protein
MAPVPAPAPALDGIPLVNKDIGIFTYATAFVHKVGVKIPFVPLFHCEDAVISIVLAIRDPPAPDVAIHEYPVQAIPFNRPNVVFVSVKLPDGFFHSLDPFTVLVNATWSAVLDVTSPTTTHIGEAAPVLYMTALLFDNTGGMPPSVPDMVDAAHPVPISSPSARHEIRLAGAPDPAPPPPQQIHADPLYPIDVIRIPGNTEAPPAVEIARHPVAPVRSLV